MSFLFPKEPRSFPYRRTVRTLLRTLHILAMGTLLGGHIFNQPVAILEPWLWAAVLSGSLLLATDMHASFDVFLQVHGLVVLLKVGLLLTVPFFWDQRVWILILVLIIGSVSSHMPGRFRHRYVIGKKS